MAKWEGRTGPRDAQAPWGFRRQGAEAGRAPRPAGPRREPAQGQRTSPEAPPAQGVGQGSHSRAPAPTGRAGGAPQTSLTAPAELSLPSKLLISCTKFPDVEILT